MYQIKINTVGLLHFETFLKSNSQANLQFPESLHQNIAQLLESKRGSDKNTLHPGLPVDKARLVQQIIQQLRETLLSSPIGEVLKAHQASLAEGESLQLVIQSEDRSIRNLPWETIAEFTEFGELSGVVNLNIMRTMQPSCTAFQAQQIPAPTAAPLKLLFVTALPENISERGKELQIEDEQRKLIEAVGNLEATGDRRPKMVIEFLDVASLEEMTAALKARRHDILHISGHGGFNEKINQAVLHLENEDGDHLPTEDRDFAEALRGHDSLRLVVLSACETAVVGPDGGMVEAVAGIGVPAVLGMRFTVGDNEVKLFTTHFYQHLANGAPITDALSRARLELWKAAQEWKQAYPDHPRLGEWFTPVLYLNGAVGALVDAELPFREMDDFYPRPADGKRRIGSGFIGRKRQLIQMRRAFRAGRHVCLVGMGGMGKTTLAEAFAANYENGGYDTIILRGGTEIHEFGILNQLALAYGRRHGGKDLKAVRNVIENGEMPILNRLHYVIGQCLKDEKVILVFDNFEDLQDQSGGENSRGIVSEELRAFLGYLIGHCPAGCHLLFTTRYWIEGLPEAVEMLNLDKLSPAEQYRWLSYSRELRFVPAADRLAIYRRLDGLPRAFQFLEALARNKKDFDWGNLEAELGKVEARVFENLILGRIYGLLSPDLQRVFLVTSVFFTRTPIGALVAVLEGEFEEEALWDCLGRLLDWGLCFWDGREFEVHGITREWVMKNALIEASSRKFVAMAAGSYFSEISEWDTKHIAKQYYEIAEEWEQYALCGFWTQIRAVGLGNLLLALSICSEIMEKPVSPNRKIQAYNEIGVLETYKGHFSSALSIFKECFHLADKFNESLAIKSRALVNMAGVYKQLHQYDNAIQSLGHARELQIVLKDRQSEATTLNNLGEIEAIKKNYQEALKLFDESLVILKEEGLAVLQTITAINIALVLSALGDPEMAKEVVEKALVAVREYGDLHTESGALHTLGCILDTLNKKEEALEALQASLMIQQELGLHTIRDITLFNIGKVLFEKNEFAKAAYYFLSSYSHSANSNSTVSKDSSKYLEAISRALGATRFQEILYEFQ